MWWKKFLVLAGLTLFVAGVAIGLALIVTPHFLSSANQDVLGVKVAAPASLFSTPTNAEKNKVKNLLRYSKAQVKRNVVKLKTSALLENAGGGKMKLKNRLSLNLLDKVKLIAALRKTEEISPGKFVGYGTIEGIENSFATLVSKGDMLTGNIYLPDKIYEIRPAGNGLTIINQIDPKKFPPDDNVVSSAPNLTDAVMSMDLSTTTIDVMVVYTTQARQDAGSVGAIESLIDLAVADANMAYENSLVPQKLNLVHTAEVNYTEPASNDSSAELTALKDPADGVMDNVHTLRDQYNADIVTLFITNAKKADGTDVCGIGYQMDSGNKDDFAALAFNVVPLDCISNLSYPHELGHNMGAGHEETNASPTGLYDFSHGTQDPDCKYRSIMAYPCSCVGACTRMPFFSNPDVEYDDWTTGISGQADNALTLLLTRNTVADFRNKLSIYQPLSDVNLNQLNQLLPGVQNFDLQNLGKETQVLGGNFNVTFWLGMAADDQIYEQTFKASGPAVNNKVTVKGVSIAASRIGNPPFLVRVAIRSDKTGADLAYAAVERDKISAEALSDSSWVRADFSRPLSLTSGATYYLVVYVPSHDASNYYNLGGESIITNGDLYQGNDAVPFYNLMGKIHYETNLNGVNVP